jgi:hypothetical protein
MTEPKMRLGEKMRGRMGNSRRCEIHKILKAKPLTSLDSFNIMATSRNTEYGANVVKLKSGDSTNPVQWFDSIKHMAARADPNIWEYVVQFLAGERDGSFVIDLQRNPMLTSSVEVVKLAHPTMSDKEIETRMAQNHKSLERYKQSSAIMISEIRQSVSEELWICLGDKIERLAVQLDYLGVIQLLERAEGAVWRGR